MANMTIPTSRDIYLELNGKKLAVVQGYSAKALRTSREVEAFGESEPVATWAGRRAIRSSSTACTRRTRPSATA